MAGARTRIPPALWVVFILVDVVIVGAIVAAFFWVAPVPAGFQRAGAGQAGAVGAAGARTGQVTVALVTADWCLMCQMYKRGGLSDPRVTEWLGRHAETTYLRWDKDKQEIERLGVAGYPTTLVLDGGNVLASHRGVMSGDELLEFLERGLAAKGDGVGGAGGGG